jgi:DUF4097 and DUF4098 domain-containing protein YvlB
MFGHALLVLMLLAQTDQTVDVKNGAKLDVSNFSGDVIIRAWEKNQVRVQVEHSDRETVDILTTDQLVTIRGRGQGNVPRSLNYTITIPAWMPVNSSGTAADVDIDGTGADINVETVRGDVKVRGGSGYVRLHSVQGNISLERAKGRIDVRTYNESINLADVSGDISAEAINGAVTMERIDSSNVDVSTVNGPITFDGQIKDRGLYRLTTHNGRIDVAIGERTNATMTVRTFNGDVTSTLPIKIDEPERHRRTVTLGTGSAHVELESFNGTIVLRRPGEARPPQDADGGRQRGRRVRSPRPPAPPSPPAPPAPPE